MAINTYAGFKQLVEAGVPERQAEATVQLFADWAERQLVTREHLDLRLSELEVRIDRRFADVELRIAELDAKVDRVAAELRAEMGELRLEMAELEKRLTLRMVIVAGAVTGILGTLMTVLSFFNS